MYPEVFCCLGFKKSSDESFALISSEGLLDTVLTIYRLKVNLRFFFFSQKLNSFLKEEGRKKTNEQFLINITPPPRKNREYKMRGNAIHCPKSE